MIVCRIGFHWPSWFIICSRNSDAIRGKMGKGKKNKNTVSFGSAHRPNREQQTDLSTAGKAIPLGSAKIHGVIFLDSGFNGRYVASMVFS